MEGYKCSLSFRSTATLCEDLISFDFLSVHSPAYLPYRSKGPCETDPSAGLILVKPDIKGFIKHKDLLQIVVFKFFLMVPASYHLKDEIKKRRASISKNKMPTERLWAFSFLMKCLLQSYRCPPTTLNKLEQVFTVC